MGLPYEILLAGRNLNRHPWHTAAMIVGLGLAVLVMVYIPSTMSSFYDDLIDRAVEQNSAHVTVWPREKPRGQMADALRARAGTDLLVDLDDRTYPRHHYLNGQRAISQRARHTPGVQAVAEFVRGNATVSRGKVNHGLVLEGIEPVEYARVVNIAQHFPDGRAPKLGPNDIAVGFRMADRLGVHIDEHVHVATGQTRRLMRVKAIFHSGYYQKDMNHGYVSLRTAQRLFAMGTEVSAVAARCADLQYAPQVGKALDSRLQHKVRNWQDDNASLLAQIATVDRITFFVTLLVAMVTTVGMANVFSMFVLNRQKELAILRAVGASQFSLRGILAMEAMVVWLIGATIGCTLVLGVMAYEQLHPLNVSAERFGIASFATSPKPMAFVWALALTLASVYGAAWWGGRRAAKLNPAAVIFGR